ncbi:hypothetical protein HYH03_001400 [Edaphochlamys debaryana]|uniref:Sodium/solute symporter n=1 Tax=Edaphochlamys debaryana TaxID=47281 RepID=A0A835YG78_9CHLO|nr:hypothetical protein HYH03_001400 [Edaphochlamys debaryana]|eukprot:KAG2500633.1 hypothetical protein HYH03_001400 [Edaphochlamys debaryana]
MANEAVSYAVLGTYLLVVLGAGILAALANLRRVQHGGDEVREHYLAGKGLGTFVWFWTMMATLFSGYSVSGIVNEAYNTGWSATRWIPAGVGLYIAFAIMAPRLHSLSKRRGYFTLSQVIHDRYMRPGDKWSNYVGHTLALLSFWCLQVPVFTYLITQFQSLGREVSTFTAGSITATTAICVAAAVLLICDLLGGMRAVAWTDVIQGIVLFFGSIIFLIIQGTELGGLQAAHKVWSNPANDKAIPRYVTMQTVPNEQGIVSYFDFVAKTTVAATMFPHLTARLFAARKADVIRRGMATMVFTFFVVQLSSMITGWTASAAIPKLPPGKSAFGAMLLLVANEGGGQAFASALLLASAVCAMMSTADSALLACSSMWVRDIYTKYVRPHASPREQLIFGKIIAFVALAIGVFLGNYSLVQGKPDLSGLFALQNTTPIHVVPAIWLGLHWRGLRGEAVLVGMVCGLGVTLGIMFSDKNVLLKKGSDLTAMGISSAWFGFVVNFGLTVIIGLALQYYYPPLPEPLPLIEDDLDNESETSSADTPSPTTEAEAAVAKGIEAPPPPPIPDDVPVVGPAAVSHFVQRPLDIGTHHDRTLNPYMWFFMFLVLLFTVPFYRVPMSWDGYVGAIGAWPFTSLLLSGVLAFLGSFTYIYLWEDYKPVREADQMPHDLPPAPIVAVGAPEMLPPAEGAQAWTQAQAQDQPAEGQPAVAIQA